MAKNISFADLSKKVQSRKIKASEVQRFFTLDPANTTGLHPRFRINPNEVDISGLEGTATDAGHALAIEGRVCCKGK